MVTAHIPFLGDIFSLATAFCWALSPLIAYRALENFGIFHFCWYRFVLSSVMLFFLSLYTGQMHLIGWHSMVYLALAGVFALTFGETCLFQSISYLGPRIAPIIFFLNAPLTALSGAIIFHETITPLAFLGVVFAVCGVYIAIICRATSEKQGGKFHKPESMFKGFLLVSLAVIFQTIATLISKAGIEKEYIFQGSFLRVLAATVTFFPLYLLFRNKRDIVKFRYIILSSFTSHVFGTTLLLAALAYTQVFKVAVVSSLFPILYIIIASIFLSERFVLGAWIGTILAIFGGILTVMPA